MHGDAIARIKEAVSLRKPYKHLALTEPQVFWLTILLETTLSAADNSKATKSYEAVLRKLK